MSAQWFYTKNGQRMGPVTDAELKQLAASGTILPTDQIWKEGMSEWKPASTLKSLFPTPSINAPPAPNQTVGTKNIWQNMSKMADTISSVTKESIGGEEAKENKPAIFLHEQYFGGRTRIGSNLKPLQTFGGKIFAAIMSWMYISAVLKSTISSWQFIPFKYTEYAKITLRQSIKWDQVFPVFAVWIIFCLISVVGGIVFGLLTLGLGLIAIPVGIIIANIIACQMVAGMNLDDLHKTEIVFEYGFPQKHLLLFGISDAPISQQMEGVLMLCEAISKAEFSRWDQFTAHSASPSSMMSRVVSAVPGMGR